MNLFYVEPTDVALPILTLRGQEARHAGRVLRYGEGDEIFVTCGTGFLYRAIITQPGRDRMILKVMETSPEEPEIPWLTLCLGLIKKRDRLEYAIEKAVEIGVNEIVIFRGRYSQKEKIREDRLAAAALAAMKQSLRCYLPDIHVAGSLRMALKNFANDTTVVMADETTDNRELNIPGRGSVFLVVGPEGGFSAEERDELTKMDAQSYSLGEKRLRSETAAAIITDRFRK